MKIFNKDTVEGKDKKAFREKEKQFTQLVFSCSKFNTDFKKEKDLQYFEEMYKLSISVEELYEELIAEFPTIAKKYGGLVFKTYAKSEFRDAIRKMMNEEI